MGLFETALISMCIAASSGQSHQAACEKTTEAYSQQTGYFKNPNAVVKHQETVFTRSAEDVFGEDGVSVVAGGIFLAKSVASKSLSVGLPNFDICNSMRAEFRENSSLLKLEWRF